MPQYEYRCTSCDHRFTVSLSISQHEEMDRNHEIHCPKCDSREVTHVIESIYVTTSKKS